MKQKTLIFCLAAAIAPSLSAAQGDADTAMREAFAAVIANPQDVDANLAYARAAEAAGETRKAIAAYDRALAAEPGNEDALTGLRRLGAAPAKERAEADAERTTIDLAIGVIHETNPNLRDEDLQSDADWGVSYAARLSDSRPIYGLRIDSALSFAGIDRLDDGDTVDIKGFGLQTGPVFDLSGLTGSPGLSLKTAGSFSMAYFGDKGFGDKLLKSYGLRFDLRTPAWGPVESLRVGYAFDDYDGRLTNQRTAHVFDLGATAAFEGVGLDGDAIILSPRLVHNAAQSATFRWTEFGSEAAYVAPLPAYLGFEQSAARLEADIGYRAYTEEFNALNEDRGDLYVSLGGRYTLAQWDTLPVALSASYHYDFNNSNVTTFDWTNQRVGLTASWRFAP